MNEFLMTFNGTYDLLTFGWLFNSALTNELIRVSIIFASLLFLVSLYMEMYRHVMEQGGNYLKAIIRIWIVFMCINYYGYLVGNAINVADYFPKKYGLQTNIIDTIEKSKNLKKRDAQAIQKDKDGLKTNNTKPPKDKPVWVKISDFLGKLSIQGILVGFVLFIAQALVIIISAIRNVSLTVLIILGPVAIATFANPIIQEYGSGWIKSFINVASWPIWMTLLVWIQNQLLDKAIAIDSTPSKMIIFAYNVVLIFLLLQVPTFLPNMLLGKAGSVSPAPLAMAALGVASWLAKKSAPAVKDVGSKIIDASKHRPTLSDTMDPFQLRKNQMVQRTPTLPAPPPGHEHEPKITGVL